MAGFSPVYASPPQNQIHGSFQGQLFNGAPGAPQRQPDFDQYSAVIVPPFAGFEQQQVAADVQGAVEDVFGSPMGSDFGSPIPGVNRLAASPRSFEMIGPAPQTPEGQVYNVFSAAASPASSAGTFDSPIRHAVNLALAAADSPARALGEHLGFDVLGIDPSLLAWAMEE